MWEVSSCDLEKRILRHKYYKRSKILLLYKNWKWYYQGGNAITQAVRQICLYQRHRLSLPCHFGSLSQDTLAMVYGDKWMTLVNQLKSFMAETMATLDSSSILLLGPSGCGKTRALEYVLSDLEGYSLQKGIIKSLLTIRVSGIEAADDRHALEMITKALGQRLQDHLGHPLVEAYGSYFENLVSLPYLLDTAKKQEFGIVIVLDFFESFAFRPRQTLLYTLLDRLQTSKASVCLVGLSNRLDCVEYLEKRIKSRFSHRRLLFLQQERSSLDTSSIKDKLNALLSFDKKAEDNLRGRGYAIVPNTIQQYKDIVERELTEEMLVSAKDTIQLNPCPQSILDFARIFLTKILKDPCILNGGLVKTDRPVDVSSEWESVLLETSALELILLVAFVRLSRAKSVAAANFDTLWNEYDTLRVHKVKMVDRFDRRAVYRAFESLERSKLIGTEENGPRHKKISIYNQAMQLRISCQTIEGILQAHNQCPAFLKTWIKSEFVGDALE